MRVLISLLVCPTYPLPDGLVILYTVPCVIADLGERRQASDGRDLDDAYAACPRHSHLAGQPTFLALTFQLLSLLLYAAEGLVKISQSLYESILPLVKTQVESQVRR